MAQALSASTWKCFFWKPKAETHREGWVGSLERTTRDRPLYLTIIAFTEKKVRNG